MPELTVYEHNRDVFLETLERTQRFHNISRDQFILNNAYRKAEYGSQWQDACFILSEKDRDIALVLAHKINQELKFNTSGISIVPLDDSDIDNKITIYNLLVFAREAGASRIYIQDPFNGTHLSELGSRLYSNKASFQQKLYAQIDLLQSPETIRRNIRKSYKSLINKGLRDLEITYCSSDNYDETIFREFQEFHKKVAGRVTRPGASWDIQLDMIREGVGELITARRKGEQNILCGSFFTDFGPETTYAVGVYDRLQFNNALAHPLVFEGVMRAKDRGQKFFNLGELISYSEDRQKEYNICMFKKGFTNQIKPFLEWNLPLE